MIIQKPENKAKISGNIHKHKITTKAVLKIFQNFSTVILVLQTVLAASLLAKRRILRI